MSGEDLALGACPLSLGKCNAVARKSDETLSACINEDFEHLSIIFTFGAFLYLVLCYVVFQAIFFFIPGNYIK